MSLYENNLRYVDDEYSIPPLEYPRDFFNLVTGSSPQNEEAAALLWSYRKARPNKNNIEMEPPDGFAMMNEIENIRSSLRLSIIKQYNEEARKNAKELNLYFEQIGSVPITPKDLKKVLSNLINTEENQKIVYQVCYEFHKERYWLANAVDKWFVENNMVLLPGTGNGKNYASQRGGFGAVARIAKSQATAQLMKPMLNKAGWCIGTTNNKRNSSLKYTKSVINIGGKSVTYYIVTGTIAEGENIELLDGEVNEDEEESNAANKKFVDLASLLDYSNIASMMTKNLGVLVTEETIQQAVLQSIKPNCKLIGTSLEINQMNEDTLTSMTPVDHNHTTSVTKMSRFTDRAANTDIDYNNELQFEEHNNQASSLGTPHDDNYGNNNNDDNNIYSIYDDININGNQDNNSIYNNIEDTNICNNNNCITNTSTTEATITDKSLLTPSINLTIKNTVCANSITIASEQTSHSIRVSKYY